MGIDEINQRVIKKINKTDILPANPFSLLSRELRFEI